MKLRRLLANVFTALMPGKARHAQTLDRDLKLAKQHKTIVVRTANDNACEMCANAAGPHEWDDPDCWVTHPNCQCTWDYEDTADMSETTPTDLTAGLPLDAFLQFAAMGLLDSDAIETALTEDDLPPAEFFEEEPAAFAAHGGRGNERALLGYWAKQMPKTAAGGGSDFNDCVNKLKGKPGIKTPEALCNWLHQKSRGAPPGKAPGEHTGGNHGHAHHSDVVEIEGVATFAGDGAVGRYLDQTTQEWVYPNALMWRAGDYPLRHYSMTRAENAACVARFSSVAPVEANIEHSPFLHGRAGRWTRAWIDPLNPDQIRGEVRIPDWLDQHLTDEERKPSVGWTRATKMPEHFALTAKPHVIGAALFSAAKELTEMGDQAQFGGPRGMGHNTHHGQMAMQNIHDEATRGGAVCNPPANMASRHEANAIQQAHDLAAQHGAKCDSTQGMARPVFSGSSPEEGKRMSFKDRLTALFGGNLSPEEQQEIDRITAPATFSVESDPAFKRIQDELAAERGKRITAEATAFADGLISAGRAMTAEREALIAKFSRAASDDYAHGTADFSGYGDSKSRVAELVAVESARPQSYAQARPKPGESRVLGAHTSDPATFSGETQLSEEEERKATADRLRQTAAYKGIVGTTNGTHSAQ